MLTDVADRAGRAFQFSTEKLKYAVVLAWQFFIYAACLAGVMLTVVAYRGQEQLTDKSAKVDLTHAVELLYNQNYKYYELRNIERMIGDYDAELTRRKCPTDVAKMNDDCNVLYTSREQVKKNKTSKTDEIKDVEDAMDVFGKKQPGLFQLAVEMRVLQFNGLDIADLVFVPLTLLTLLLCMAMGALGSAMHMTQEFFKGPNEKAFAWYIFRPFLGIMLAVATFILFKSGQVVLTVTPGANGAATDTALNPFVVSFVAIISGLLSEQAYRRICDAGSQLLAAKDAGVPRFLRPSVAAKALEKANKPGADLGRFVNSDGAMIKDWLDGRKPVGPAEQTVVAAWLDMPGWEVFTDQQPSVNHGDGKADVSKGGGGNGEQREPEVAVGSIQSAETTPDTGPEEAAPVNVPLQTGKAQTGEEAETKEPEASDERNSEIVESSELPRAKAA